MRRSYDFKNATQSPFAERLRKEGASVKVLHLDGTVTLRTFPPGTVPAKGKTVHVFATGKGWEVRSEGSSRPYRRATSEAEALKIARELAKKNQADLTLHFRVSEPRTNRYGGKG